MNNNKRGLGSPYLRRRTWWIRYSVRRKRYRESSESENRADAVRLLKARGCGGLCGDSSEVSERSGLDGGEDGIRTSGTVCLTHRDGY
jgi:hypothetical protein